MDGYGENFYRSNQNDVGCTKHSDNNWIIECMPSKIDTSACLKSDWCDAVEKCAFLYEWCACRIQSFSIIRRQSDSINHIMTHIIKWNSKHSIHWRCINEFCWTIFGFWLGMVFKSKEHHHSVMNFAGWLNPWGCFYSNQWIELRLVHLLPFEMLVKQNSLMLQSTGVHVQFLYRSCNAKVIFNVQREQYNHKNTQLNSFGWKYFYPSRVQELSSRDNRNLTTKTFFPSVLMRCAKWCREINKFKVRRIAILIWQCLLHFGVTFAQSLTELFRKQIQFAYISLFESPICLNWVLQSKMIQNKYEIKVAVTN